MGYKNKLMETITNSLIKTKLLIFIVIILPFNTVNSQPSNGVVSVEIVFRLFDNGQPVNMQKAHRDYNFPAYNNDDDYSYLVHTSLFTAYLGLNEIKVNPYTTQIKSGGMIIDNIMTIHYGDILNQGIVYLDSLPFQTGIFELVYSKDTIPYRWKGRNLKKVRLVKLLNPRPNQDNEFVIGYSYNDKIFKNSIDIDLLNYCKSSFKDTLIYNQIDSIDCKNDFLNLGSKNRISNNSISFLLVKGGIRIIFANSNTYSDFNLIKVNYNLKIIPYSLLKPYLKEKVYNIISK